MPSATTSSVKDSAGDSFTELLHFKASDGTEMSIWSAPVTAGGGKIPTITATPSAKADVGVAVLEYAGLSTEAGTAVVDQSADATGTTKAAAVVSTPATAATTAPGELVVGFYADSGFDDNLMARMGFNDRVNVSPDEEMEFVAEDALTGATGATPSASVQTGASTIWLMAAIVFKSAAASEPQAAPLAAPARLVATPANGGAIVTWTAPRNGGSPITTYTVTPYQGRHELPSTTVSGTSAAIGGLKNGVSYRFRVVAHNRLGTGPKSRLTRKIKPSRSAMWAFWCTPFSMAPNVSGSILSSLTSGKLVLPNGQAVIWSGAHLR